MDNIRWMMLLLVLRNPFGNGQFMHRSQTGSRMPHARLRDLSKRSCSLFYGLTLFVSGYFLAECANMPSTYRLRGSLTDSQGPGAYTTPSLGYFVYRGDFVSNVTSEGIVPAPTTGTEDDDDDRDDEHEGENEAPIREVDEQTEAPDEFEVDDEDELPHPEDDDADVLDEA
jgi:hypothetical protein